MDSELTYEVLVHKIEGYLSIIAKGGINLENLKQMYTSVLKNPQYESGMSRLWDFTQLNVSLLTSNDLESFAQFMQEKHLGTDVISTAIINTHVPDAAISKNVQWVQPDLETGSKLRVIMTDLIDETAGWQHESGKIAQVIISLLQ